MSKREYQYLTAVAYVGGEVINVYTGTYDIGDKNNVGKIVQQMVGINKHTEKVVIHELKRVNFERIGTINVK